jgi:Dna[CI] antecedent, DciA
MAFRKATESCSVELKTLLPSLLRKMEKLQQDRPQQIIDAWPKVVGEKWALLSKAASFVDGILIVKVKNSTVLSQLVQYEKQKILKSLREKFPSHTIHEIRFCMG